MMLPISDFKPKARYRNGLSPRCRECDREQARLHYIANRDANVQRTAKWVKDNRERRREIVRLSDKRCRDRRRASGLVKSPGRPRVSEEARKLRQRVDAHIRRQRIGNARRMDKDGV